MAYCYLCCVKNYLIILGLFVFGYTQAQDSIVKRGPFLQMPLANSIIVKWYTTIKTPTHVYYGTQQNNLNLNFSNTDSTLEHKATLVNLEPNTKYYYKIYLSGNSYLGDSTYYFITQTNENKAFNIWVTGDQGTGFNTQTNVMNGYSQFMQNSHTDLWLLLGDNAYASGLDSEYTHLFFKPYMAGLQMRQTPILPAPGNHDYYNTTDLNSRQTPYFNIFELPVNGELGGLASDNESFYSYNYSNVHFASLDSYGTETDMKLYDTTGTQYQWLKKDLEQNTQLWTILYWHHPPITKGNHDCDTEQELINIRKNLTDLIDKHQVDLVLNGHSHAYERSKRIKGFKGLEIDFNDSIFRTDSTSAKYDGSINSCPHIKNENSNEGTIYNVCGCSGKTDVTTSGWPHAAMLVSENTMPGSLSIQINNNRLDSYFILSDGSVYDHYTIMKNVNQRKEEYYFPGSLVSLDASWIGNYNWNTGDTSASIFHELHSDTMVVVSDHYQCLSDTFNLMIDSLSGMETKQTNTLLYPNANDGTFKVQLPFIEETDIELYLLDESGKKMEVSYYKENSYTIKVNAKKIPTATYFLIINNAGITYKQKVAIQ